MQIKLTSPQTPWKNFARDLLFDSTIAVTSVVAAHPFFG